MKDCCVYSSPACLSLCVQTGFPNPDEWQESEWLKTFLEDPVLNDKMMTDAMNPPCIKSEHSYSINYLTTDPGSPLGLTNGDGELSKQKWPEDALKRIASYFLSYFYSYYFFYILSTCYLSTWTTLRWPMWLMGYHLLLMPQHGLIVSKIEFVCHFRLH